MAGARTSDPRTVLEYLLRQRTQTYEEVVTDFDKTAQGLGERGVSITARHLRRLASGERASVSPATQRVLQHLFGRALDELLAPFVHGEIIQASGSASSGVVLLGSDPDRDRKVLEVAAERAKKFGLTASQTALNDDTMEQVYEDVRQLALAYPQRPLHEILSGLVEAQDSVFSLLEQRNRPSHARQLYFLSGVVGGLLAKASHDMGNPHAAMTQTRTAFICADQADHNGLRAWIRGLQSLVSYWAGRPNESVRYAQGGQEFALASRNTTSVWLPVSEARAWAALGNARQTQEALRRAEGAWEDIRPDELDELGGIATFGRARQLYYAADALAWLPSEVESAQDYSAQAVEAYSDTSNPEWAFGDRAGSHSDLAIARITAGELEGATEAIAPVLELPSAQRNNGIIRSVQHVQTALLKSSLAGDSQELQEEIEAFTRVPLPSATR
jgi:hypothetical protein